MAEFFSVCLFFGRIGKVHPAILGCVAIAGGALLIAVGRSNLATRRATEFGFRPRNAFFPSERRSYEGRDAVILGWLRIGGGVAAILLGVAALVAELWPS